MPDDTYQRLNEIARTRGVSVGQLFDRLAATLVAEADAEARFRARAQRGRGQAERGLALLRQAAGEDEGIGETK
nr:toxin-antitoxin system HicB family antitoxin [Thiocystis violacea]